MQSLLVTTCTNNLVAFADCDYVLEPGKILFDNGDLNLLEASIIGILGGDRNTIAFRNFHGNEDNPYILLWHRRGRPLSSRNYFKSQHCWKSIC